MEIEMAKKPARNMKTIYVPADVDIYELIEQAAPVLLTLGYDITKLATRRDKQGETEQVATINDSAVMIAALRHVISLKD